MSKQEFAVIAAGFLVLFGIVFYATQCGESGCNTGVGVAPPTTFEECVARKYPVRMTTPRQCQSSDGTVFTEGSGASTKGMPVTISLSEPVKDATVGLPLTIAGTAEVPEDQVHYRVRDADGTVLMEGMARAAKTGTGGEKSFSVSASYDEPFGNKGTVDVFGQEIDGRETGVVSVPITFGKADARTVQMYFLDVSKDPQRLRCDQTYGFARRLPSTDTPMRTAAEALLGGPTALDAQRGASTAIPGGVTVRSLTLKGGTATVDLSRELQGNVAGACRTAAIRSQITQTLLQFPGVKKVTIMVEGKSKGVLQP